MPAFRSQSIQNLNSPGVTRSMVIDALLPIVAVECVLVGWGGTLWLRHAMRTSLPQLDGTLHVAALSQPVTVRRDAHGVPHISAANMDDLIVAQGYVTAQDRLWQLDMLRRFASGNLAEILGSRAVEHDRAQRILEIGRAADAALAAMDPADRHFLEDYARGVNAYIAADAGPSAGRVSLAALSSGPVDAARLGAGGDEPGADAERGLPDQVDAGKN